MIDRLFGDTPLSDPESTSLLHSQPEIDTDRDIHRETIQSDNQQ